MERNYVNENGSRRRPNQIIADLRREKGVSLSNGSAQSEGLKGSGHQYGIGYIDSFCQIYTAYAITMTPGEWVSWETSLPDYPDALIDPTAENGAVILFEYAMGNGSAYPQPNGYFELSVDGEPVIRFNMKKSSCLFESEEGARLYLEVKRRKATANPGEQFSLDSFIQNESLYVNGTAYLYLPQRLLRGRAGLTLSVSAHNLDPESKRWFRVGFNYFLLQGELFGGLQSVLQEVKRPTLDGENIFFGDIHVHTAQTGFLDGDGCGLGTVESNLAYARDVSKLDFCAITDHDWQLDAADWKAVREENDLFNQDGRFVALNAYEWTSSTYGHRNVYFRDGGEIPAALKPFNYQAEPYEPIKYGVGSPNDPTPQALWDWLEKHRFEAMTFSHHPNSEQFVMDFDKFFNPKYDRCVEVYSSWGTMFDRDHPLNLCSERLADYEYKRYAKHIQFGFVASSDGHDGNAGDGNVAKDKNHLSHYAGSGRVAVITEELSRAAVYDALKARHCYAVTGEPILLSVRIVDAIMGDMIPPQANLPIRVHAVGTFPITRITLYKNGEKLFDLPVSGKNEVDYTGTLPGSDEASYYVEVSQSDGEYAWSSPILCVKWEHSAPFE